MIKLLGVFVSIFLAELGDKTQLAILALAATGDVSRTGVFIAGSAALIASTGLAVLVGATSGALLKGAPLKLISGLIFIAIGVFYVIEHFRGGS